MKEKILQQLKLACGENTSTSDRTLDTLATLLSAGITEETEIPAVIEKYKPLLKEFDGNISAVAAKAVKSVQQTPPVVPPVVPPVTPPAPPAEPDWAKEIKAKIAGIEKGQQVETMLAVAKNNFYTKYQVSDAEKALCEKSLDLHMKLNPTPESAEKIIEGWKSQYEDLRSAQGLGALVPVGSNAGGGGSEGNSALKSLKEKLQREGKIPVPSSQN